jgi:hypothetical protein
VVVIAVAVEVAVIMAEHLDVDEVVMAAARVAKSKKSRVRVVRMADMCPEDVVVDIAVGDTDEEAAVVKPDRVVRKKAVTTRKAEIRRLPVVVAVIEDAAVVDDHSPVDEVADPTNPRVEKMVGMRKQRTALAPAEKAISNGSCMCMSTNQHFSVPNPSGN